MSERYQPPPKSACEILDFPVDLGEEHGVRHVLHVNMWLSQRRIVRFSLQQSPSTMVNVILWPGSTPATVKSTGMLFDRAGQEIGPTQLYATVPPHGQDIVEDWYERAYDLMACSWSEFVRRWRRGR